MIKTIKSLRKSVSKAPEAFSLPTVFSTFLALLKDTAVYQSSFGNHTDISKINCSKLGHLCKDTNLKYFWQVKKILAGL